MEFGLQNQYGRVIYPSIGNFIWSRKKYTFGGQKGEGEREGISILKLKSVLLVFSSIISILDRHFEIANEWNSIDYHVAFPKCIHVLKTVNKWLNGTKNYKILV
jgi:hypothetical protein